MLVLQLVVVTLLLSACSSTPSPPASTVSLTEAQRASFLQDASAAHERAQSLFEKGYFLEAIAPAEKAVAIRERFLEPQHEDVAAALTTLGEIRSTLIDLGQAKTFLERALEIRRSLFGSSHPKVAESLTKLGALTYAAGDFVQAIRLLEQSLKIREQALGHAHPDVAVSLTHLAIAQRGMSRLSQASASAEQAITILRTTQPSRPIDLAVAVNVAGNILARSGNFEHARSLLEESLHLFEQAAGPHHPYVGGALMQLAMLEGKQGNHDAALPLLEQALAINERGYGKSNPEVAGTLYEIGLAERALGHIAAAEDKFERALAIQEATVDPGHPFVALNLIELAEVKLQQGDRAAARAQLQRALQIQEESLGRDHTSLAHTLTNLGYLEALSHNLSAAEQDFDRALRIREKALGPTHRDVAASLLDFARAKHAQGELPAARPLYERARRILQTQAGMNPGLDDEALSRIWKKDVKGFQDYAELLATLARTSKPSPEQQSAVADGFTVTQQARGWLMQAAVAKVLAQRETGSSADIALAKQVEELRRKRQEIWTRLNELYGLADAQRPTDDLTKWKQSLLDTQQKLDRATAQLHAAAPRYAELAQPEGLNIEGVQRLLRQKEALVSFYTLGDRVQIWLIRHDHTTVYREAPVGRAKLMSLVQQIRESVLPKVNQATNESMPVPFDVEDAAEVYQLLFGSIESSLSGIDHLILVPDDVLLPLPFAALITQQSGDTFTHLVELYRRKQTPLPKDLASYAALSWLAKSYPLTILPSASALRLLRQHVVARTSQGEPFLGFGDPVLLGKGNRRGGKMLATRGMRVAVDSLHALDRLPGTREEVLTVANVLHVNPETSVFLGHRATEAEVHRLNHSGRLGQAKVLLFATHGLLAGEVQGVTQPSLVLTPPTVPTDDNDGLLSMEDVLQLRLPNTDWVILSACNTAGGDGSGESLSGLARAFFFAGAKGLLVSQWSVDDRATQELMTQIFRRYGATRSVPPAEALQQGMLALLQLSNTSPGRAYFAHPFAWASFFLVGDGRGPLR